MTREDNRAQEAARREQLQERAIAKWRQAEANGLRIRELSQQWDRLNEQLAALREAARPRYAPKAEVDALIGRMDRNEAERRALQRENERAAGLQTLGGAASPKSSAFLDFIQRRRTP